MAIVAVVVIIIIGSTIAGGVIKKEENPALTAKHHSLITQFGGGFAFISEFTSGGNYSNYGWKLICGTEAPIISYSTTYFGEPSLALTEGTSIATHRNIVEGFHSVSFQYAMRIPGESGTFEVTSSSGMSVASVTVAGGTAYIGTNPEVAPVAKSIPNSDLLSGGWLLVSGNLFQNNSGSNLPWTFQVFLGGTDSVFGEISAPLGSDYSGIELSSGDGSAYFTDVIVSNEQIGFIQQGQNSMEGYGQGSGSLFSLMQPFDTVRADVLLNNWTSSLFGVFSIQINVMNYTGALNPTGIGFFQLGVDLDPNGLIAPWHVNGVNEVAMYFPDHIGPTDFPGFSTPNGTILQLTIFYNTSAHDILFQIVDESIWGSGRYWNAVIPYSGPPFYAAYTQMEASAVNMTQTTGFGFSGEMFNISYGQVPNYLTPFNSSYMVPYFINTPNSWNLGYYNQSISGYSQSVSQ